MDYREEKMKGLTIAYTADPIDNNLEEDLDKVMDKYGYKRYGDSLDPEERIRMLFYDIKKEQEWAH